MASGNLRSVIRLGSLRLVRIPGLTLALGVAIFLISGVASEAILRTGVVMSTFKMVPIIRGGAPFAGTKMDELDELIRQGEHFDCVIVGSSMAENALYPEYISRAFQQETGRPLKCFNYAYHGLGAAGSSVVARIVERKYQPGLILYGTAYRDYLLGPNYHLRVPWTEYQLGELSSEGWAEASFLTYRYANSLNYAFNSPKKMQNAYANYLDDLQYRGYRYSESVHGMNPETMSIKPEQILTEQSLSQDELAGLDAILALRQGGTSVVLVEMPFAQVWLDRLPEATRSRQQFLDLMSQHIDGKGVQFYEATYQDLLPADGWQNPGHLNHMGAEALSAWVGQQLGEAVKAGKLTIPDRQQR